MSALQLAFLAQIALSCPAAAGFPEGRALDRVSATAQAESGLQTTALHDNTTGQSYFPASDAEAAALVTALHAQGHRLDAGIMQVSDANWSRLWLTTETVFDPRLNVCAGMTVMAEAYAVERRVSCRYNTGHPECANGYPERIEGALRRVRAEMALGSAILAKVSPQLTEPSAPSNPFVDHAPARELTFAPAFLPAPQLHDGLRSAAPAAPAPLAASPLGRGEFVSMRSLN